MQEKKIDRTFSNMRLVKVVREFAGLKPWAMFRKMKRKNVQSYLSLERSARRISLADFFLLEKIFLEAGGTKADFEKLARKCAEE